MKIKSLWVGSIPTLVATAPTTSKVIEYFTFAFSLRHNYTHLWWVFCWETLGIKYNKLQDLRNPPSLKLQRAEQTNNKIQETFLYKSVGGRVKTLQRSLDFARDDIVRNPKKQLLRYKRITRSNFLIKLEFVVAIFEKITSFRHCEEV